MSTYGDSYRRGFDRIVAFIDGRDVDVIVPACPDWTALDLMRHLAGDAEDVVSGNLAGLATPDWTQAHLDRRADMDLDEVILDWRSNLDATATALDNVESLGLPNSIEAAWGPVKPAALPATLIGDILHHEFDLRNAYGDRSGRDIMDIHFSAAGHAKSIRGGFAVRGLPTIRIESSDSGMGWDIGMEAPEATMRATSFQIMRGIGGRRTRDEIRGMGWDRDPEPFLDAMVLPHLAMPAQSLRE